MRIRAEGRGAQPMWIIFKFYNIIIKSANVDKGAGGYNAYPQNVDKKTCFLTPPLETLRTLFEFFLTIFDRLRLFWTSFRPVCTI